jgi:hypothetical protein
MTKLPVLLSVLLLLPPAPVAAAGLNPASWGTPLPTTDPLPLLAKERGGARVAGGKGGKRAPARTGLGRDTTSLRRGERRPSGGWSRQVGEGNKARRSFDRSSLDRSRDHANRIDSDRVRRSFNAIDRNAVRDRVGHVDRDDWNHLRDRADHRLDRARDRADDRLDRAEDRLERSRDSWDDRFDRGWDRVDRRVDRAMDRIDDWDNHWPGWVRPGWGVARPWNAGWYGGWNNPPWGWWAARSVAWGLGSLATAAVINNAVNDSIAASRTTIVVPESDYTLYFNSVQPSDDQLVNFVASEGQNRLTMQADCRNGLLNGQTPSTAGQAQLLNATCQVTFGSE